MLVFDNPHYDKHEKVVFGYDEASGLRTILALHSTALGPALGGCRVYPYASEEAALADALRLSRGMSYKSAMADLPVGGGKSVIIADPAKDKSEALLEAMGAFVDTFNGDYIVAKDMGTEVEDLVIMGRRTKHVSGTRDLVDANGAPRNGDPSPSTVYGIFCGIMATVEHQLKRSDLEGLSVAIQGLGSVGYRLAGMLKEQGAKLYVADTRAETLERAQQELGAQVVSGEEILYLDVDILSPCAIGAVINDESVDRIQAKIVAGAANNQLATSAHGERLFQRGILYAPDYVINAGGLIDAWYMETNPDDAQGLKAKVENIGNTLQEIYRESQRSNLATHLVADRIAEERMGVSSRS